MGESRNFTALDWVTGEINETLIQARLALESYVSNPDDPTQIRFCLTYLHQVHGILQMVEFNGGALLAEELEGLAQALLDDKVSNTQEAYEILMRAILQLPVYLDHVKSARHDDPNSLLPLLNDLRAVRGSPLLTETSLFSPNMAAARKIEGPRANISDEKFADAVKKLRQMYQLALVGIIKDKDYDGNLPQLEKVFSNFEKLSQGTRYFPLWQVSLALVEGLVNDSISAGAAISNLLREIEKVIKRIATDGKPALDHFTSEELIKNLLYYIAGSNGLTPRVKAIKEIFKLEGSLPKIDASAEGAGFMAGVDPDAMRSVVMALSEEFAKIKEVFDSYVNKQEENNDALKKTIPLFKQAADTLAVLGQGAQRKIIENLTEELSALANSDELATGDHLMTAASKILEVEGVLNSRFNGSTTADAPPSMDIAMLTAQGTVLFECQNGLEQAKDAIVEYLASQWDSQHIAPLPALLMEIRGSLEMVGQRRSARVLGACSRYIKEKLIDGKHTPDWREMDTLADAIAGVEYYLETLDEDVVEEEDTVLAVAEESVANLGYAVSSFRKQGATVVAEEKLSDSNETDASVAAPDDQAKREPLTKEKLAAILAGGGAEDDAVKKAAQKAEKEGLKKLNRTNAAMPVPDSGPLLSDEEFNSVSTVTSGLELETEFNFDRLADQTVSPPPPPPKENGDYGAIEFESTVSTDLELPEQEAVTEKVEAEIEVAEVEASLPQATDEIKWIEPGEEIVLGEVIEELPQVENVIAEALGITASTSATDQEDPGVLMVDNFENDFDDEIAEIFIEEVEEVLLHINEFYPQWKASAFKDEASLKEFRRGFHTMKGSGRMAKALSVGELAWSVENMLNRVMDGTIKADRTVCELVERTLLKVPGMMKAFSNKQQDPDPRLSRRYRLIGEAISKGEAPLPFELSGASAGEPSLYAQETEVQQGVAVEAVMDVVQEPEVEIDWELWEIFSTEAESHLVVADEWIAYACEQAPLPVSPTDPLQRALHTLKGSAYMAEINTVAELVAPLEKFVKALRSFQIQVGSDFTQLLVESVEEVRSALAQMQEHKKPVLPNKQNLLARINTMRLELTGESESDIAAELGKAGQPAPSTAKVDPALFNEFLAGEMDALMGAREILAAWQENPQHTSDMQRLYQELEKMAESAEPAGLLPITTLGRLLIKAYNTVFESSGARVNELIPLAQEGHDTLINFVDELAGGQDIVSHAALEAKLQTFIDTVYETEEISSEEVVEELEPELVAAPPVTEKITPVQLVSPDDFDAELLTIFIEEAAELLDELDGTIGSWHDDPTDSSFADALKRNLHTYKGGARMAGLSVLGTLAHDLETQLETFSGIADEALFTKIHDYQDRLIKGTERARILLSGQAVSFAEFAMDAIDETAVEAVNIDDEMLELSSESIGIENIDFAESAEEIPLSTVDETYEEPAAVVVQTEAAPVGEVLEYSSDIDPDLLEIFIEEASELLEDLDRGIAEWQQDPAGSGFVDSLKRTLHTLKGGARMAGMTGLGSLAHDLETYLETFTGAGDEALFAMLHDYQDRIIRGVEQTQALASGEAPQVVPAAKEISASAAKIIDMAGSAAELVSGEEAGEQMPAHYEASQEDVRVSADILPFRASNLPKGLDKQADKLAAAEQAARSAGPQEMVKIAAELVDQLVNLAGETSITRGRVEQQVIDFGLTLNDVEGTIKRMQDLLRRMEIETEAQVQSKIEEFQSRKDDFDPLEMDRYSTLQQLTRSLMETSSDLIDLRIQLTNKARETEMILLQQSRINTELQEGLMRSRMVPFSRMVPRLRRIVRQVSGELKKDIDFDLVNVEGEMDRTVLERMVAPLEHMLRNALDHGIELPAVREKAGKSRRGYVVLSFGREGGDVVITLKDDGGGIPVDKVRKKAIERGLITEDIQLSDHEILQFIMQAGFSTAEKVTQISGRGVGMDVVQSEIKQLGGTVTINSIQGAGTEFVVRLPFTVSVNRALMVKTGDDLYAVPLNSIEGIVRVSPFELENYYQDKTAHFEYAGELYDVRYLGELLQTKARPNMDGLISPEAVILVRGADHSLALHVDELLGSREVVVKSLGAQFAGVPGLSGATILGDGSVVVILDLMALVRATILLESQNVIMHLEQKAKAKEVFTVMVVDDSVTVRKVTSRFLEREGFEVILAKDGADAMLQLQDVKPDIMLLDIEMPRMDGFEVASAVKNSDRLKDLPIIMITSRTGEKHRERAMGIGVERYMGKPFVEDELLQTINTLIAEKVRQKAVAE